MSASSSDDYSACSCGWECDIWGCKTNCKNIVSNLNKGIRGYDISTYKKKHGGSGDIFIAAHMWGFSVRSDKCPYKETNCYVYHIAMEHNEKGCKRELENNGICKFRCPGCDRVIMPNSAFIKHAENHSDTIDFQRIQWKKTKENEKIILEQNKKIEKQCKEIEEMRKQLEVLMSKEKVNEKELPEI